jgi:hypothetical protein
MTKQGGRVSMQRGSVGGSTNVSRASDRRPTRRIAPSRPRPERDAPHARRLEMVRLSDAGWSIPRIAVPLQSCEPTVRYWIEAFLARGFDADEAGFAPTLPTTNSWYPVGERLSIPYEAPQGRRVNAIGAYFSHGPLAGRFDFETYARLPESRAKKRRVSLEEQAAAHGLSGEEPASRASSG